jgi:hypothetical protein
LISNKPECGQMLRKQQNSLKTNKLRAYDWNNAAVRQDGVTR